MGRWPDLVVCQSAHRTTTSLQWGLVKLELLSASLWASNYLWDQSLFVDTESEDGTETALAF